MKRPGSSEEGRVASIAARARALSHRAERAAVACRPECASSLSPMARPGAQRSRTASYRRSRRERSTLGARGSTAPSPHEPAAPRPTIPRAQQQAPPRPQPALRDPGRRDRAPIDRAAHDPPREHARSASATRLRNPAQGRTGGTVARPAGTPPARLLPPATDCAGCASSAREPLATSRGRPRQTQPRLPSRRGRGSTRATPPCGKYDNAQLRT